MSDQHRLITLVEYHLGLSSRGVRAEFSADEFDAETITLTRIDGATLSFSEVESGLNRGFHLTYGGGEVHEAEDTKDLVGRIDSWAGPAKPRHIVSRDGREHTLLAQGVSVTKRYATPPRFADQVLGDLVRDLFRQYPDAAPIGRVDPERQ